ncbi:MAG: RNA polymerase sigma factor [Deltaproteobacteria bacterium]|nr:RNA polymerase sigma factor [Deltaproteobacteria bacterium]
MPRHHTQPTVVPLPPPTAALDGVSADVARVAQVRAGHMEGWAELYQAHYAAIFRHVRYLGGGGAPVEDLVQEVFARALVGLPGFDGRSPFSTWLHGVAVNVVRNHWRSRQSTETAHQRLQDINAVHRVSASNEVDRVHMHRRRAEAVYAILDQLPSHLREAFVLRDLEGFSPADAAQQLGISPGNLSVRASRARERIRKELEQLGWLAARKEQSS